MNRFRFVATGLALAFTCEFFHKLFAFHRPGALIPAFIWYVLTLLLLFEVRRRVTSIPVFAAAAGLYGLLFLEWILVGNSPWGNPNASQSLMLLFHTVYPTAALIVAEGRAPDLTGKMSRFWARFILFTLLGLAIPNEFLRFAWFIYVPMLGYLGLVPGIVGYAALERRTRRSVDTPDML